MFKQYFTHKNNASSLKKIFTPKRIFSLFVASTLFFSIVNMARTFNLEEKINTANLATQSLTNKSTSTNKSSSAANKSNKKQKKSNNAGNSSLPSASANPTTQNPVASPTTLKNTANAQGPNLTPKLAVNLGNLGYYTSNYAFINMMHTATHFSWQGKVQYENKNGWIENLPAGGIVTSLVVAELDKNYGYLRPGKYKAVTTSGATLKIQPYAGLSDVVNGVNVATFTVKQEADSVYNDDKGYRIVLEVHNNTKATIPLIDDIKLYHMDDEADLLMGKIYTQGFKDQIKKLNTLRAMDWLNTNISQISEVSELPTERSRVWHDSDGLDASQQVPYSVITKLMLEIGAETGKTPNFWVNIPIGNKNYFAPSDAANSSFQLQLNEQNQASPFKDGEPVFLAAENWQYCPKGLKPNQKYYIINSAGKVKLANSAGGSAITFGERVANSPGSSNPYHPSIQSMRDPQALYNKIFSEIYKTEHTISGITYKASNVLKVYVELSNETWNDQFGQTHWLHGAGVGMLSTSHAAYPNAWLSLKAWKAAENAGFARNKIVRVLGGQAVYFEHNGDGLNYVDKGGIIKADAAVKDIADAYAIAPYFGFLPPKSTNLDYTIEQAINDGLQNASDATLTTYANSGISLIAGLVGVTKTKLAALNPNLILTSYEGGQHVVDYNGVGNASSANIEKFSQRVKRFLRDDTIATAIHKTYFNEVYVKNGLEEYNQFFSSGGWTNRPERRQFSQWGIARSTHSPDTDLLKWWKSQ